MVFMERRFEISISKLEYSSGVTRKAEEREKSLEMRCLRGAIVWVSLP